MPEVRVADLSALLGGELIGNAENRVDRIGTLQEADARTVSFLAHPRYESLLASTHAGCVIVGPRHRERAAGLPSAIVCDDPYLAYARLTQWWARSRSGNSAEAGIHPSAVVDPTAQVDATARVEALAVIGSGAKVGAGAWVGPHAVMESHTVLGEGSRLGARCVIGHGCRVGDRCILHPGVVIGADGFGFAPHQGRWKRSSNWARCASVTMWRSAPTPVWTGARWTTP